MENIDIKYEKATEQDVEEIATMHTKLNAMLNLNDAEEVDAISHFYFIDYLKDSINEGSAVYYLAKIENKVVGCVSVNVYEDAIISEIGNFNCGISFIYVDEKFRNGKIAFNLFKLAIKEIKNKGYSSLAMCVEDNNPNKYLHFAFADVLLDKREEELETNGSTTQYVLGVTDLTKLEKITFKDLMMRSVQTKRNFNKVLQNIPTPHSNISIIA